MTASVNVGGEIAVLYPDKLGCYVRLAYDADSMKENKPIPKGGYFRINVSDGNYSFDVCDGVGRLYQRLTNNAGDDRPRLAG